MSWLEHSQDFRFRKAYQTKIYSDLGSLFGWRKLHPIRIKQCMFILSSNATWLRLKKFENC